MSLIVQKFGGSSVRDYAHLLRMARIVKSRVDEGDDVVVVLSAQGDTTDGLLQKGKGDQRAAFAARSSTCCSPRASR